MQPATGDDDAIELVLYVPLKVPLGHARMVETTATESRALWAESVAASHEALLRFGAYTPGRRAKVPTLLSELRAERAFELPAIRLASSGWEPIGLGAIQDLVQEAFGPVDLEQTPVRLESGSFLPRGDFRGRRLDARTHRDAHSRLGKLERAESAFRTAADDSCSCGSGRKYKHCCGT
jgi:SEC-C motif